jgi:hypothetical protein
MISFFRERAKVLLIAIKDLLIAIDYYLRISDTFIDAFRHRFFGFLFMAILPALNAFDLKFYFFGIAWIIFWLLFIRFTLDKRENIGE